MIRFLQHRHAMEWHLDAEVAARDHDRVRRFGDLLDLLDRAVALELGHQRQVAAGLANRRSHRLEIGRPADIARRDVVGALRYRQPDVGAVLG